MNSGDLSKKIEQAMVEKLQDHLRARFTSIRHPKTGEFPTLVFFGNKLDNMKVKFEGSPELLQVVQKCLQEDDSYSDVKSFAHTMESSKTPKVFLSYTSKDKDLAETIAHKLQANGIDVWWDNWCINAGDSLRQKIDDGLESCTDFIVLLTPNSIEKPWVNQEMDAGLVLKLNSQCKFIPLRHDLPARKLPPLLAGMKSPELTNFEQDISALINDLHGASRKPPLGKKPDFLEDAQTKDTSYSPAAMAIAKVFVEKSPHANFADVQTSIEELQDATSLTKEDVEDALHELFGMVQIDFGTRVLVKSELYPEFDKFWMGWDPAQDALKLAADLLNDNNFPTDVQKIAELYNWPARRINSTLSYMLQRNLTKDRKVLGCRPWLMPSIDATADMRRFLKSRQ